MRRKERKVLTAAGSVDVVHDVHASHHSACEEKAASIG
jgi:hypothetical protein